MPIPPPCSGGGIHVANKDTSHVSLEGMVFHGFHGVLPEERVLGQKFVVDTWMWLAISPHEHSLQEDPLQGDSSKEKPSRETFSQEHSLQERSVDYSHVYSIVRTELTGAPHLLLESVAYSVARQLLLTCPALARVAVRVSKPHVAFSGVLKSVGVQLECHRQTLREDDRSNASETGKNEKEKEGEEEKGGGEQGHTGMVAVVVGESSTAKNAQNAEEKEISVVVAVDRESSMLVLEGLVFYCQGGAGGREGGETQEGEGGGEGGERQEGEGGSEGGERRGKGAERGSFGACMFGPRIEVDMCAWVDLAAAAESDELQDSVDYGEIYDIARQQVEGHPPPPPLLLSPAPLLPRSARLSLACTECGSEWLLPAQYPCVG
ncbi:hypothetical protein CLOP_g22110 [Closterium sp. NIES-67]|nr:hypothetical protein CLOP_g22110 [Closterium sp. NIES-67]